MRISYKTELRALASSSSFLSQTCKKKVINRRGKEAVSDIRPMTWCEAVMQVGESLWRGARLWGCVGVSPGEACIEEGIEDQDGGNRMGWAGG